MPISTERVYNMIKRALILDDDIAKADLVSVWLNKSGVVSDKVYSFEEAVNRVRIKYDYLILDYFLDGNKTGSDFAVMYQKEHPGCQIYVYSAMPEDVKDCTAIDINDLETFIQDKIRFSKRQELDEKEPNNSSAYNIYVIKQELDDDISELRALVTRHDEKICQQEKCQEELKTDINKLNTTVYKFITDHSDDARKIILWVAGVLVTIFSVFIGIEWAIIEHLIKQLIK